jgi:hypothetical protein
MNPLDPIMDLRVDVIKSIRLSQYMVEQSPENIPLKFQFGSMTISEFGATIEHYIIDFDDMVIVSLVSAFESTIIDYLKEKQYCDKPEDMRFTDALDLLKDKIDPRDLGNCGKQPYEYRCWVAHGKNRHKPLNLTPDACYDRLTKILIAIGKAA